MNYLSRIHREEVSRALLSLWWALSAHHTVVTALQGGGRADETGLWESSPLHKGTIVPMDTSHRRQISDSKTGGFEIQKRAEGLNWVMITGKASRGRRL